MARNQRKYNTEYKVQAVKLSNEIGSSKAAVELGIPVDTLYGWVKAVKEGRLDIGGGAHTPQTAMSLAEELNTLRKQVKQQEKEIRRLKEENEFLAEASAWLPQLFQNCLICCTLILPVAHWHDGESFVADAFWESERFIVSHLYNSPLPTTLPYVQSEGL